MDARIGERESVHLLARHAPLGPKVEHHVAAAGRLDSRIELGHAFDLLKRQLRSHRGGAACHPAERPEQIAAARQRAHQQRDAAHQRDHADPFKQTPVSSRIGRQRIDRMHEHRGDDQQRPPQ